MIFQVYWRTLNLIPTTIIRHILVKDKDMTKQLKKCIHSDADFSKITKQ